MSRLLRNANAADLIELCLVAAVATVLVIRLILELSGYPQLGSGGLHIAHVLYGGMILLIALLLGFTLLNSAVPWVAALFGGIGFGFFIDEVGKFVTSDVNYFFEPAVAIIYVVFMVLFLVLAGIRRWERVVTPADALANALAMLSAGAATGLDAEGRDRVGALLDRSDPSVPLVGVLRDHLSELRLAPPRRRSPYLAARAWLAERYRQVVLEKWFTRVVVLAAILYFLGKLPLTIRVQVDDSGLDHDTSNADLAHVVQALAATAVCACIAIGLARLRRSRLSAYRWFLRGVLVSILVYEVFVFYYAQFAALGSLTIDLLLYFALRYMIAREEVEAAVAERVAARAPEAAQAG